VLPPPSPGTEVGLVPAARVVSGEASGRERTKKYVNAIIPRMTRGRIQRPGFGSGLTAITGETIAVAW
jgi:hypothetical protein